MASLNETHSFAKNAYDSGNRESYLRSLYIIVTVIPFLIIVCLIITLSGKCRLEHAVAIVELVNPSEATCVIDITDSEHGDIPEATLV
jgi:hypothetical protein